MSEQANEVAGPDVVDEAPKAGTEVVVIKTEVEEYKELAAGLAAMFQRCHNVVYDLRSVKGDKQARADRKALVTTRTSLDKRRKELNAADKATIAARIALRDSEYERLEGLVRSLENPIDEQISRDEERREAERIARENAERERVEALRQKVNAISETAVQVAGKSSSEIALSIAELTKLVIDESYSEFLPTAIHARAGTLLKLQELLAAAAAREEAAALAEQNRLRLAQLEQQERERVAREAEAQRARDAAEAEERKKAERARKQLEAQQQAAAHLVAEIQVVRKRAFASSAAGLLELATMLEAISIGPELGDQGAAVETAKQDAIAEVHQLHGMAVQRESDKREQDKLRAAQQKAESDQRMWMSQIDGIGQQYQIAHVGRAPYYTGGNVADVEKIIAETERWTIDADNFGTYVGLAQMTKDATLVKLRAYLAELIAKRDAPPQTNTEAQPAGPVGNGIPISDDAAAIPGAKAGQDEDYFVEGKILWTSSKRPIENVEPKPEVDERPDINVSEIQRRLGFDIKSVFLEKTLGIEGEHGKGKNSIFFREAQWPLIKQALIKHVQELPE